MNIKQPQIDFRKIFRYDVTSGVLIRISSGKPAYIKYKAARYRDYGYVKVNGKQYAIHRVVWAVVHGDWPSKALDHIDRDKRNNKIENLREVSIQENQQNLPKYGNNTSGETGITKVSTGYRIRIGYKHKRICLGTFDTMEEAAKVRDAAYEALGYHPNHGKN
jgi:hypothetical protein